MPASPSLLVTLTCGVALALVHLLAGKLRFLEGIPRGSWLSFAGGSAVAYVFVHLLPDVGTGQETTAADSPLAGVVLLEHPGYVTALLGLVVYYGLEHAAWRSRKQGDGTNDATGPAVLWLHLVAFSLYNGVIGYLLLHRTEESGTGLLWYTVAMAFHFVVNDTSLSEHHKHRYENYGRWILAAAVLLGWGAGVVAQIPEPYPELLFAFVAGGIVLNVLKEELPAERDSRFGAFLLGCLSYTLLLVLSS